MTGDGSMEPGLDPARADELIRQARAGRMSQADPLSRLITAMIAPDPGAEAGEDAAGREFRAALDARRPASGPRDGE